MSKSLLMAWLLLPCIAITGETPEELRFYEIEMTTAPSYDNHFLVGVSKLARGQIEESIRLLEGVKRVTREAYYYLGIAYYRIGDYDRSADCFGDFNKYRNDVWQSYYYLILINLKHGDIDNAKDLLHRIPDPVEQQKLSRYISEYEMLNEASRSIVEQRYEDAIELYRQVEGFHGYREIGMALAYARMGRYKESLSLLDSVIHHSSDETLVQWGLLEAGKELALLQEMRKAKQYLRQYLELVSDNNAKYLMGKILSEEAKYDSAIMYLVDLPDTVDVYVFYKGRTEYFLGLWGNAEEKLLRHQESFPKSLYADRTLYILASINFKRREYGNAVQFWKVLVDSFPLSPYVAAALQGMGDSYFNMREYAEALDAYHRVKDHFPSERISAEVSLRVYETRYYLGKYPSLHDALRKYVRANPSSVLVDRVRLRIANIHYERGEYYQSIHELDRIIDDNRSQGIEIEALMQRVQVCQAMGDERELMFSLRSLLNSENAAEYRFYAINELGALSAEEMRYDSALYYYNLLLDSDVYKENAIMKIAGIYSQLGRYQESIAMTQRLINEYPKSAYLVDAYTLKSRALKNEGDYRSATEILHDLISKVGERADVYMEIGNLYFESEEFLDARKNYLKACELYTQNREDAAQALLLAGDASVAIGDIAKGKEYYLHANMIAESHLTKNKAMQKLTALSEQ
ncbi:MAG: tetratricopeptide repeat protein [candidate division WOR-3 bacterium]|nr:MAG: tetratricopeptide repeat protein [candidate division WOR-3 bacterium]